ncbi:MAG: LPS export ABC transporter permease LptF [Candidatus Magnetomorum sp.]|nr:LPS export ABC transporter permease LptF [Candidatus Magnetomorum sp.]
MKVTILHRYLLREIVPPFCVNLLVFCCIFLISKMLEITRLIVIYQMDIFSVLKIVAHSIPSFLIFVLPMSVMMGILLALLRLSSDNEIMAIKTGGVHIYHLLPPVLFFSILGCALTLLMTIYGAPASRMATKNLLIQVVRSNLNAGLKERTFNDRFQGVMLYVTTIDPQTGLLKHLFVQDHRDSKMTRTIIASSGKIFSDNETGQFQLQLFDGVINQVDQAQSSVYSVHFDQYYFNLDLDQLIKDVVKDQQKSFKELTLKELRGSLNQDVPDKEYDLRLMEYHKKFSIPFACIVLSLLAMPLGIGTQSQRRSFGVVLGLIFFLLYYLLLSLSMGFAESSGLPIVLCIWAPNIIIFVLAYYLLIRAAQERPFMLPVLFLFKKK